MKMFVFILSVALCGISFFAHAEDHCPPIEMIQNTQFTQAMLYDDVNYTWLMFSDSFAFNSQQWNVYFGVTLEGEKDPTNAVAKGNEYFKHSIMVNPIFYDEGKHRACLYSPNGAKYVIIALNPPVNGPTSSLHLK